MTTPVITSLPTPPNPSDRSTFNTRAYPWSLALGTFTTEVNSAATWMNTTLTATQSYSNQANGYYLQAAENAALAEQAAAAAMNGPTTYAETTESITFGTGSKTFYMHPGKTWSKGQFIVIASATDPTKYMSGQIINYDSLLQRIIVNVTVSTGTGTESSWVFSLTANSDSSFIANTPNGNISSVTVQGAINELDSEKFAKSGGTLTGDVTLIGTGRRIIGNFSGVPVANRTLFQTSVANEATTVGIIPNGTNNTAYYSISNSSDPDNAAYGYLGFSSNALVLTSTALGSGTKLPINIDGKLNIGIDGSTLSTGGGGLGYGTGAGGTVTQTGTRTSGVVLNKPSGQITLVSAAGSPSWQSFTLTNSSISSTDGVVVTQRSGADLYVIAVTAVATGSCRISFATTGGTTTEQPVFNFQVVKGATS